MPRPTDATPAVPAAPAVPALAAPAVRFVVTGAASAACAYVMFRLVLRLVGDQPRAVGLAQALVYAIGIVGTYLVTRGWTFRSALGHTRTAPRFVASHLVALALSTVGLQLGVNALGLPTTPCWVAANGAAAVVNFALQRFWVFPQ